MTFCEIEKANAYLIRIKYELQSFLIVFFLIIKRYCIYSF